MKAEYGDGHPASTPTQNAVIGKALNARSRHLATFLGAMPAFFSAALAMLRLMFFALYTAGVTNLSAQTTEIRGELRSSAHEGRCPPAGFRTVSVEPNAVHHLLDIRLAQTGIGAMLARLSTFHAGFDARRISFVGHHLPPSTITSITVLRRNCCATPVAKT